jgi:hypothetical protein
METFFTEKVSGVYIVSMVYQKNLLAISSLLALLASLQLCSASLL